MPVKERASRLKKKKLEPWKKRREKEIALLCNLGKKFMREDGHIFTEGKGSVTDPKEG